MVDFGPRRCDVVTGPTPRAGATGDAGGESGSMRGWS